MTARSGDDTAAAWGGKAECGAKALLLLPTYRCPIMAASVTYSLSCSGQQAS